MGKPKENTIEKIDRLMMQLKDSTLSASQKEIVTALGNRCHTMNIHKAKLAYFKEIKLILTRSLVAAENGQNRDNEQWRQLETEVLRLLNAKNG
jgi:uncharacterized protein (UPF0303 family)